MWQNTKIENYLDKQLKAKYNEQEASYFNSLYSTAKSYLCNNVYSQITGAEPSLTDHTERHIENVLNMAWKLISEDDNITSFNEIEVLLLCVCILFHDVGNIHGRKEHNKKVADIYNLARSGQLDRCKQERAILLRIVAAHCGVTISGSKDTLLNLRETDNLFDREIKMRELAAILRFADELAEGPQRTSQYMIDKGLIPNDSLIYHKYAAITEVFLDKGNNRVALTYNIDYPIKELSLEELLKFVYRRILKMDAERRYCKYYAPALNDLLRTEANINFTINGDICEIDLPKICLEDKYRLSDVDESIEYFIKSNPGLSIDSIEKKLQEIANSINN